MVRMKLQSGWEFCLCEPGGEPAEGDFRPVAIPHDWLIYDTENLYRDGDGYYRRMIVADDPSKCFSLRFDGVYQDCEVRLNGEKIFEWKYGYTAFDVPLRGIRRGENTLTVLVRHRHPNSRWYSGAGIFRNVWLTVKGDSEILPDGVYVATRQSGSGFATEIDTEVRGTGRGLLRHTISDQSGAVMAFGEREAELSDSAAAVQMRLPEFSPRLWSPEEPNLYILKTELIKGGETVDYVIQKIGYKTLEFTTDRGLILNGRQYKLNGTCIHHDCGALGSAVNKNAIKRQFNILKEMGVNALRTSHNPPATEFLDLCDEMGFLVVDECFDMWERPKNAFDYHRFFPEWHERDVASWVRRDRSRACLLMWSIGNEISDTGFLPRGAEITKELSRLVKIHDYKRLYPVTLGSNTMHGEGGQECAKYLDAVGYNYGEKLYDQHRKKYPDWIIYGSETSSTYQSRGVYHFPAATVTSTYDDEQCSSLLNCATSYGAINTEWNITMDRVREFSLGQFIWTALDYIGEPTPFHTKNSHFGHVDTAGFKKDTYYAYKAEWALSGEPFVHLYPHWDWNEGQLIDLFIFSNCHSSELWVNGVCMGRHIHDHSGFGQLSGRWQVLYHRGEIRAIGYDENGRKVAEMTRRSFSDPARLVLRPDKTALSADGEDLIYVEISAEDKDGNPVENARNRVTVEVGGAGRLMGLDNGDSTDYDQYKGTSRRMFNGKLLAIVGARDFAGKITLTARSEGVAGAELNLTAEPFDGEAAPCCDECRESPENREVPVRRIDLKLTGNTLTPDCPEVRAEAKLYPENTTFTPDDIFFKVTSDSGVTTNISKVSFNGGRAVIRAVGDGKCRLRAFCRNGTPYEAIISELEMTNCGFGPASFDPYSGTVSASISSRTSEPLQVVMQGGVQTFADRRTWVGFDSVDFGVPGTEELTVGIFSYSSGPIPFDLCDGEGNVLESFTYQAESRWNTYQYNTFKLKNRLFGTRDIIFSFGESLRFEGFSFKKMPLLGSFIAANQRSSVFGDRFAEEGDAIKNIGNNVTVIFDGLITGGEVTALEISGQTKNAAESIRIVIESEAGERTEAVEFSGGEAHAERYPVSVPAGRLKLTLLYLPGCDFDLYGIRLI